MIESYSFLKSVLDTTTDHIVVLDHKGNIIFANRAWSSFAQQNNCPIDSDWIGLNYLKICDDSAATGDELAKTAADGIRQLISNEQAIFYLEYACHSPDEQRWFMMRVKSFTLQGSSFFVISHHNITERKEAELAIAQQNVLLEEAKDQFEHLALYDTLTGLGNRNLFLQQLEQLIVTAARKNEEVPLLAMDLDGFKEINDRLGHAAGDSVLREFSSRLGQVLSQADQKYRIGGDEFAVLLEPRRQSLGGALAEATKIARHLAGPMEINGHSFSIAVSIGVAVFPQHGNDVDTILRKADAAMYEAKMTRQVVAGASELDAATVLDRLHSGT